MGLLKRALVKTKLASFQNNNEKVFGFIYKTNFWGNGSGAGSTIKGTKEYREYLESFLKKYKVETVLDAGCGDWQFSKTINWGKINYVGLDVVEEVVKRNNESFGELFFNFYCVDITKAELPKGDLLLVKDVLQHLSNENIKKILAQLPNFHYALITNDYALKNKDISNGWHRGLNLRGSPFNLKAKRVLLLNGKETLLWKKNF